MNVLAFEKKYLRLWKINCDRIFIIKICLSNVNFYKNTLTYEFLLANCKSVTKYDSLIVTPVSKNGDDDDDDDDVLLIMMLMSSIHTW